MAFEHYVSPQKSSIRAIPYNLQVSVLYPRFREVDAARSWLIPALPAS